jgi:hypothetical protein
MKNTLLLFSMIILVFSTFAQYDCDDKVDDDTTFTGVCEENYPNGKVHFRTTYYNGQKEGEYEEFYPSGKQKAIGNYKNWDLVGSAKRYHANGAIELIIETDSVGNGELIRYYDNGKVKTSGRFKFGFREGLWIEYGKTGGIISKEEKNEYNWMINLQKESDEKNSNDDPDDDFYVVWNWITEEEFFLNEDWY